MPARLGTQIALALIGLVLATAGGWAVVEESAAPLAGPASLERVAAWTRKLPRPGLSILTQKAVMLDCLNALHGRDSLAMRYLPDDTRAAIAPTCLTLADALVASEPTFSYAWLVGAQASAARGDTAGLNRRLLRAQQTGPAEQWIAESRVALAEDNLEALDPQVRAGHDADLLLLALSQRGAGTIAVRYVVDPGFRERITAIVETTPDTNQRQFLASVRSRIRQLQVAR